MDERAFIDRRRPEWEHLAAILQRTSSGGLKSLSGPELHDLGKLYRRVTSDLSYANANSASEDLLIYLNELAGRAHGYVYADAPSGGIGPAVGFLLRGFPILFRGKFRFIAAAALIFILASILAGVSVGLDRNTSDSFLPRQFESVGSDSSPDAKHAEGVPIPATLSSQIMINNIWVSCAAFAGGVTFGLFTVFALIQNGVLLGALAVVYCTSWTKTIDFWSLILPHGIIELTAIFIAGGAGLILAWALIAPGNLSRWDSLRRASREAVPLIGGVVAMLIIAGCIEGFITPAPLPPELKLAFAAVTGIALILYFGRAGREAQ